MYSKYIVAICERYFAIKWCRSLYILPTASYQLLRSKYIRAAHFDQEPISPVPTNTLNRNPYSRPRSYPLRSGKPDRSEDPFCCMPIPELWKIVERLLVLEAFKVLCGGAFQGRSPPTALFSQHSDTLAVVDKYSDPLFLCLCCQTLIESVAFLLNLDNNNTCITLWHLRIHVTDRRVLVGEPLLHNY